MHRRTLFALLPLLAALSLCSCSTTREMDSNARVHELMKCSAWAQFDPDPSAQNLYLERAIEVAGRDYIEQNGPRLLMLGSQDAFQGAEQRYKSGVSNDEYYRRKAQDCRSLLADGRL